MMWVLQRVWLSFYMPCGRYLAPIVGAYLTDVFFKCGVHNTSFFLSFESRAVGNITKCYHKYIILFNFPKPFFFHSGKLKLGSLSSLSKVTQIVVVDLVFDFRPGWLLGTT